MANYDHNQQAKEVIGKLREGAARASLAQTIAQRDYAKAQAEADKWENEYQLALKAGNKDLISRAKFQKERYQAISSLLKNLVEEQTPKVDEIKSSVNSWEKKVSELQNEILRSKPNIREVSSTFINFEDEDVDVWADDVLQPLKETLLLPPKPQEQTQIQKDAKNFLLEAIHETEEAITNAVANQEGIQKDFEKLQKEAKYWNEKAQIALKNNDDDLAFEAVVNKKVKNKIVLTIQTQLQQQETTINILVQNLMILEKLKEILGTLPN
jgi:phage shock protein A